MSDGTQVESPQSRLKAAGFTERLGFWVSPDGASVLHMNDALAGLDSGEIMPRPPSAEFPDMGVRALPAELVDLACPPPQDGPPEPPPWLVAQAQVIAAETVRQMRPVIRAEVRAELRKAAKS